MHRVVGGRRQTRQAEQLLEVDPHEPLVERARVPGADARGAELLDREPQHAAAGVDRALARPDPTDGPVDERVEPEVDRRRGARAAIRAWAHDQQRTRHGRGEHRAAAWLGRETANDAVGRRPRHGRIGRTSRRPRAVLARRQGAGVVGHQGAGVKGPWHGLGDPQAAARVVLRRLWAQRAPAKRLARRHCCRAGCDNAALGVHRELLDGEAAQPRIRRPFADDRVEDDGHALGADDPGRVDVHLPRMYSNRRAVGQRDVREQVPASQPAVDVEQEEGATAPPAARLGDVLRHGDQPRRR